MEINRITELTDFIEQSPTAFHAVQNLKTMLDKEQLFIGFKARHRFRANNNAGQIVFGEMKYLFDKDMNKIVASYDMDDDEYKTVQIVYKQMLGEDVQIEGENFDDDEVLEE